MVFLCEHEIVGHTDRDGSGEDDGECKQRVYWALAADVQIHVDSTIVVQDEIADSVSTLDGIGVAVEGFQKPRVLLGDELARAGICPEYVFTGAEKKS